MMAMSRPGSTTFTDFSVIVPAPCVNLPVDRLVNLLAAR
jgi:hypothetical protein